MYPINPPSRASATFALFGIIAILLLPGCATHQPLPKLSYQGPAPVGSKPDLPVNVSLEAGSAIGHATTTYALMPGGWAMPITSGPSPTGSFNTEDQAAFVENLVRVLNERGVLHRAEQAETAAAEIKVHFLKTEHFPDMQDYVLDVLVSARKGEMQREKVYHVSTIDGVNVMARMFQNGLDGRRRAAELLLSAVVPDLEAWLVRGEDTSHGDIEFVISKPLEVTGPRVLDFLEEKYERPSTFWKDGITLLLRRPSPRVAAIELRWDNGALPPFCIIDLYGQDGSTRVVVRERDPLLSSKVGVTEAIADLVKQLQ